MKSVLAVLVILSLVVVGCDSNDENTVNPIEKHHAVYPVFHLEIDNNYQTFGVSGVKIKVDPSIGKFTTYELYSDILVIDTTEIYAGTDSAETIYDTIISPAYTDINGYLGTLAYGSFITDIDTTVKTDPGTGKVDTLVDTSSVVFGFEPSQTYTFTFVRDEAFEWTDSFKATYAISIDSTWMRLEQVLDSVSTVPDFGVPLMTVLDSVAIIDDPADTVGNQPDSTYIQTVTFGYWNEFDTALIMIDSPMLTYPPDSTYSEDILWGFWNRVDTTFMGLDESLWCDIAVDTTIDTLVIDTIVDGIDTTFVVTDTDTTTEFRIEIVETVHEDLNGNPLIIVDTIIHYTNCDPVIDEPQWVNYDVYGWGAYDTTIHFTFPDTLKSLAIEPSSISIYNESTATTNTALVTMTTMFGSTVHSTTLLDSLTFKLTMPPEEVFPDYRIIIKDE